MARPRSTILVAALLLALVAPPAGADTTDAVPPGAVVEAVPDDAASPDDAALPDDGTVDADAVPEAAVPEAVPVVGDDQPLDVQAADPQPAAQVAAPAAGDFTFTGHGWGHGRGMGQYGALGYALDHGWSYTRILDHYYGGTTMGTRADDPITVELVSKVGTTVIVAGLDLKVNGQDVPGSGLDVVLVSKVAGGYELTRGSTCEGAFPESGRFGVFASGLTFKARSQASYDDLVRVCEGNVQRAYRGDIVVQDHEVTSQQVTFNRTSIEHYLRGVVPRESPASWGSLGDGKGMEALKAQAVAARSYALASTRPSGATTCDTISCQVYGGAAIYRWNGSAYVRSTATNDVLEQPNTDAAVAATAGQVRRHADGRTARTEFSSSTGGWTAGGVFPAVVDLGDATSRNPNHTWTVTMTAAELASRLGLPAGVQVASIAVTGRSGQGDMGGRVTELTWVGTNGVTYRRSALPEQDTIRSLLGLKSNWFSVTGISSVEAANVVRSLYADILGRGPDPTGLATWTAYLQRTGSARALTEQIVLSRERMVQIVAAQYRGAVRRAPEPAGRDGWVRHLQQGKGVYEIQIGIYASPESLIKLGGGDVPTWVNGVYEGILGRSAAMSERMSWAARAQTHGREAVVAGIAGAPEAGKRRLIAYYQTMLLRGPDPQGLASFLPLMNGRGDFTVPVQLGASQEYWKRAQTRW